jgi:hypothetical protein
VWGWEGLQVCLRSSNLAILAARAPESEDVRRAGRGQKARAGAEAEALPVSYPSCLPEGGVLRSSPK